MPKRLRLAQDKSLVRLSNGSNAGPKKCPRVDHSNNGSSSFRMYTVFIKQAILNRLGEERICKKARPHWLQLVHDVGHFGEIFNTSYKDDSNKVFKMPL
jgi:hypothetical protein